MPKTVPVYEWLLNGEPVGLGTKVEFDYHGGAKMGYVLGDVLDIEPASEDEKRQRLWGTL